MDSAPQAPPISTLPVAPLPEPKSKIWLWIVGGVLLLGVGIVFGVLLGKQLYSIPQPIPTPSPSVTSVQEGDPTANWKTYTNNNLGFTLKYPSEWLQPKETLLSTSTEVGFNDNLTIRSGIFYNQDLGRNSTFVEVVEKYLPIDGTPAKSFTIAGRDAKQVVYKTGESLFEIVILIPSSISKDEIVIISYKIFPGDTPLQNKQIDQILSTFKFLNKNSDPEGKFCGGIAANLPQNQCPDGYGCRYDNHYPDASGVCIKEFESGTLEAKVVRSPTCAGPVTGQEKCEAPYADGTFKIMRLPGNEDIQTIRTDKDGTFTTSLNPGVYILQNTESGIGKNIRNPGFTITGGKTSIQRFDVDTGIR